MKKLLILAVLSAFGITTLSAQNGCCIAKTDDNGTITVGGDMINPFGAENLTATLPVTATGSSEITVNGTKYTVGVGCLDNWDSCDEGMFNVISVAKGGDKLLEIRRPDCWTFTYGGKSETDFRKYTDNRYYIPAKIAPNLSILIFVGWPYGGELPLLTILALTDSDVKLVFNKHMAIEAITKTAKSFDMTVQSRIVEHDANNTAMNQGDIHNLYFDKGCLFFR